MNYILVDDFFDNVDEIRNLALSCKYDKSDATTGWKGFRSTLNNEDLKKQIHDKLISFNSQFKNFDLNIFFHYSLDNTKNEMQDFWRQRFHRDYSDWAGVIYLTPEPKNQSGTILFDETNKNPITIENVYNRLIMYDGNFLHGVEDTFGDDINNSRMTITIFSSLKNKKEKSLL
jgi:hypothetical protein